MPETPTERLIDPDNPWPGLESYGEEDADFFYGRSSEIQTLTDRVDHHILTILFSPSGLGKTSLLKAGLFPKLRRRGLLPIYLRLDHSDHSPTPVEQVWSGLRKHLHLTPPYDAPDCGKQTMLWEWFHDTEHGLLSPSLRGVTPVLVFDQFEEMFTIGAGGKGSTRNEESLHFLIECAHLAENRPPDSLQERVETDESEGDRFDFDVANCRILIALREAYLPQLERLRDRMPSVMQNRLALDPLSGERAMEAVTGPGGALATEAVAEKIIRFVGREASLPLKDFDVEPPLLSLVCRELNRRRLDEDLDAITPELIEGNQDAILERYYDECFEGLPPKARFWVEDELLTNAGYRDSEAYETGQQRAGPESVRQLIDARLLHLDYRGRIPRIELTHDVLATVVDNSRARRYEREGRLKAEEERQAAIDSEKRARKERRHSQIVVGIMAVLIFLMVLKWFDANSQKRRAVKTRLEAVEFFRLMSGDDLVVALGDVGRLGELNQVYSKAIQQVGDGDPQLKFGLLESRGRILQAHGRYQEANTDISDALKIAHDLEAESAEEKIIRDRYRARARFHLAGVLKDQNRIEEAKDHFETAIENQRKLSKQSITWEEATSELADSYDEYGFLLLTKTEEFAAAEKALQNSLEIWNELLSGEDKPAWKARRARTNSYLGSCLAKQGEKRADAAITYYEDGLREFEELARADQRHGPRKLAHETAIIEYGEWLRESGKVPESERHFQHVIDTFRDLGDTRPTDSCLKNTMAAGFLGMADLHSRRNEPDAEDFFAKAIQIHDKAVDENPLSIEALGGASEAHEGLADHHSRYGKFQDAAQEFNRAIDYKEKLIEIDSGNHKLKNELAFLHDALAFAHRNQGDLENARKEYQEGVDLRKTLGEEDATNAEWQLDLSRSYNYLGDLERLGDDGDSEKAREHYEAALAIREKLLADAPDDPVWRARTAYCFGQMGRIHKILKKPQESIGWHQKALKMREELAKSDPVNSTWAEDLATSHIELGEVQQVESESESARSNFEAALKIRSNLSKGEPGNPDHLAGLAECEYHLGTVTNLPLSARLEYLDKAIGEIEKLKGQVRVERSDWLEAARELRKNLNREDGDGNPPSAPAKQPD